MAVTFQYGYGYCCEGTYRKCVRHRQTCRVHVRDPNLGDDMINQFDQASEADRRVSGECLPLMLLLFMVKRELKLKLKLTLPASVHRLSASAETLPTSRSASPSLLYTSPSFRSLSSMDS